MNSTLLRYWDRGFLAWDSGDSGTCTGEGVLAFRLRSETLSSLPISLVAIPQALAWMAVRHDRRQFKQVSD